jgi:hypothetical protein
MATITTPKMAPHAGRSRWRQTLLGCGILASLLYVGMDILAAMGWEGYSYTDQTVSELFAISAPTRPLVVTLMLTYSVLMIAFGWGVWASAGRKRAARRGRPAGRIGSHGLYGAIYLDAPT